MTAAVVTPERVDDGATAGRAAGAARNRSTPSWLRRASSLLAALAVLAAAVSLIAVVGRQSATTRAHSTAEPLVLDAQTVITALSDADTTAAGSFLAGRIPPAAASTRYRDDLARASVGLASASRLAGNPDDVRAIEALSIDLPGYSGLVQTAVADQRQGFPVAASYLGEASSLLRTGMLPAASQLYQGAQRRLASERAAASRVVLAALAVAALAALVLALLWLQVAMAKRFRRILNLPSVAATVALAIVLVWSGVALSAQGRHVTRAAQTGSEPLSRYTDARILALQARADDELTLVTRDAVPSYQKDFAAVVTRVDGLLDGSGAPAVEQDTLRLASSAWSAYQRAHAAVRTADSSGDLSGAISRASGPGSADLPASAAALDAALGAGAGQAQSAFGRELTAGAGDLRALAVGVTALILLAGALVLLGAAQRLAEYR